MSHLGFTPAHAGNTMLHILPKVGIKVHPRSRGEYYLLNTDAAKVLGSPPLTRGIHHNIDALYDAYRFTPAHAGNTERQISGIWITAGSPPLTRGIQGVEQMIEIDQGFTPAHAGNTKGRTE